MTKKVLILSFSMTYIFVRLVISLTNEKIFNQYDSPSYFEFNFFSGFRLPIITFIYYFLNNLTGITVFQSVVSSMAFLIVILTTNKILDFKWQKILAGTLIIFLSFNMVVIFWDNALFSESLAMSTFLILTSAVILYFKESSRPRLFFFIYRYYTF